MKPNNDFRFWSTFDLGFRKWSKNQQFEYLNQIENSFNAYSKAIIQEKDPCAYAQLLTLHLQVGDLEDAKSFALRHSLDLDSGTQFDLLYQALLDLQQGNLIDDAIKK